MNLKIKLHWSLEPTKNLMYRSHWSGPLNVIAGHHLNDQLNINFFVRYEILLSSKTNDWSVECDQQNK